MKRYSLTHLSDESLRRELSAAAANEKLATAELLARIAEFDERRLYLPAAYPNMFAYCVGELGLSEDATAKRLQVARVSRRCPDVLEALSQGRVHLSGLVLLAPHLTPDTTDELLAAATGKSKADIERLLAERHPKMDMPASAKPIPTAPVSPYVDSHAPGHVEVTRPIATEGSPGNPNPRGRVSPLSAEAYAVQFTRSREADERFRYAQDLLGHRVAQNDIAEVYDLAMKALIAKLERTRCAATSRPGRARRTAAGSRHIPAHVKRAVWRRDEGRCTFISESGRRCEARRGLEYDHAKEFARGGEATVDGIRLRCRGHNQFTAERTFGVGFMRQKREQAVAVRAGAGRTARNEAAKGTPAAGEEVVDHDDVYRALRTLGYRAGESRRALGLCAGMIEASNEDKLRRALTYFPQRCHRVERFAVPLT